MEIRLATNEQFESMKNEWQSLLKNSDADPLFLSWHWQFNWWSHFSNSKKDQLVLLLAFEDSNLVGIAPLYLTKIKLLHLFNITRLQFIGTSATGHGGFRAEYLQFIVKYGATGVEELFFKYMLDNLQFSEIFLLDAVKSSATISALNSLPGYRRQKESGFTYITNTSTSYGSYLKTLGKNTRLRLHNRRDFIENLGEVKIKPVNLEDLDSTFELLEKLQEKRWNTTNDKLLPRMQFIQSLTNLNSIAISGIIVYLKDTAVACTLDLIAGDKAYNLQLTYNEHLHKKLSMGLLALGYSIELYCNNPGITSLDLLEGRGKNSNYKQHVAAQGIEITSINYIKTTMLQILYRCYDWL